MRALRRHRSGVTLVELLVVIVIMGVMAGVTAFALSGRRRSASGGTGHEAERARARAARTGHDVLWRDSTNTAGRWSGLIRFRPDGRAIGTAVDPLTGEPHDVR